MNRGTCWLLCVLLGPLTQVGAEPLLSDAELEPVVLPEQELTTSLLQRRIEQERQAKYNPFFFTPHRRNYILPASYSARPNQQRFEYLQEDVDMQSVEVKFQLSIKVPLLPELLGERDSLHFAYTQTSWWQAYNESASKPFRETNYQPEIFFTRESRWQLWGLDNTYNRIGYAHQSNGRTEPQSRGWDYLYVASAFSRDGWMLELAPRVRLPNANGKDDNPDLEDYLGYLDINFAFTQGRQEYVLTLRGNPAQSRGVAQLDWSFPLTRQLRGLLQLHAGFGESLIDYDHENYRVSLGIQFTNQLFSDF